MPKLPGSRKKDQKRKKLFETQNGLCYWCETKMVLIKFVPGNFIPPKNAATIDHLFHKSHPLRNIDNIKKHVLACYDCNQKRAALQVNTTEFIGKEHILNAST